jgi:hypothetical protein
MDHQNVRVRSQVGPSFSIPNPKPPDRKAVNKYLFSEDGTLGFSKTLVSFYTL